MTAPMPWLKRTAPILPGSPSQLHLSVMALLYSPRCRWPRAGMTWGPRQGEREGYDGGQMPQHPVLIRQSGPAHEDGRQGHADHPPHRP
jgi:hypothetical protein